MAGSLKDLRRILRQFKAISDSSRIPGEFQVKIVGFSVWCNCLNIRLILLAFERDLIG